MFYNHLNIKCFDILILSSILLVFCSNMGNNWLFFLAFFLHESNVVAHGQRSEVIDINNLPRDCL